MENEIKQSHAPKCSCPALSVVAIALPLFDPPVARRYITVVSPPRSCLLRLERVRVRGKGRALQCML